MLFSPAFLWLLLHIIRGGSHEEESRSPFSVVLISLTKERIASLNLWRLPTFAAFYSQIAGYSLLRGSFIVVCLFSKTKIPSLHRIVSKKRWRWSNCIQKRKRKRKERKKNQEKNPLVAYCTMVVGVASSSWDVFYLHGVLDRNIGDRWSEEE